MKIRDNNKGFIHAFLMIVLIIVCIMTAIAIPKFISTQHIRRDVQIRQVDLVVAE